MLSGLEGPTLLSALPRAGQNRCAIALVMLSAARGGVGLLLDQAAWMLWKPSSGFHTAQAIGVSL